MHYLKNLKYITRILAVEHFNYNSATAINIRSKLNDIFQEYSIISTNFIFVTDRGSNVIAALNEETRINCSAHILNNILTAIEVNVDSFKVLCTKSKNLVQYFKRSCNLHRHLKSTLRSEWNSNFKMFESIKDNWNEICLQWK